MKSKMTLGKLKHVLGKEFADLGADDAPVYRRTTLESPLVPADRDLKEGSRTAIQVVSTNMVDDYQTIIDVKGLDLERFRSNPVVLWAHDHSQPPIGSDERIWYEEGKIIAKTKYSDTDRASEVWALKSQGHLRASSISFFPTKTASNRDEDWEDVLKEYGLKLTDKNLPVEIYRESVLIEHSDVAVGANSEALVIAVSRGLNLSADIKKTLGLTTTQVKERQSPPAVAVRNISREIRNHLRHLRGKIID